MFDPCDRVNYQFSHCPVNPSTELDPCSQRGQRDAMWDCLVAQKAEQIMVGFSAGSRGSHESPCSLYR